MTSPDRSAGARRAGALALAATGAALAVGLARGGRLEPADFTFNNGAEPVSLDPATVSGIPEGRVIQALYEGLYVKHPRDLSPVPGVARSHSLSADGRTYVFHLRDDARWTNGDPVTAHDFVASWRRLLEPETGAEYAYQLWCVEGARAYTLEGPHGGGDGGAADERARRDRFDATVGIRALDDRTLEVVLESPTPYFLQLVSFYPLFPVNPRALAAARERWPDRWEIEWLRPGNIVTNGPYRLVERRINDRIRLAKFEGYWDAARVAFRTVDVLAVESYATMLDLYLTGQVHWIERLSPNAIPELAGREDFRPQPYLATYFYRVNVTRPPLDDARVRRALALTIDRGAICEKVLKAGQLPAWSLVPPGLAGYAPVELAHAGSLEEDAERARALLAEAGFGPGGRALPPIEIHFNTSEAHRDIAEVVADGWRRRLGVETRFLNQEWKVYLDTQQTLRYDVSRAVWIGDYADPNTFLDLFVTGGENNRTGWSDPRYDELVAAAARERDGARRLELLREAEALLMAELPILPIYAYVTQNLVRPRLGGWFNNVEDRHFLKFLYWMDDAELAERRRALAPGTTRVEPGGPAAGLYPPAGRPAL